MKKLLMGVMILGAVSTLAGCHPWWWGHDHHEGSGRDRQGYDRQDGNSQGSRYSGHGHESRQDRDSDHDRR